MMYWVVVTPEVFGIFDDFRFLLYVYKEMKDYITPAVNFYSAYKHWETCLTWSERYALGLDKITDFSVNWWYSR